MTSTTADGAAARTGTPRPGTSLLKNITSSWAALITNIVLSLFLSPLVVNKLGSVYYGIWVLLLQFTGYLWLFDFGVRESVIKYVAQYYAADDRESLTSIVQTAISLYALIGAAALIVAGAMVGALPYVFNLPPDAVPSARIAALLTGATVAQGFVFNVFVGILLGLQKFYIFSRTGILFSLARTGLVAGLLLAGYGIAALAAVQLVLSLAMSYVVYRICFRELPYLSIRPSRPQRSEVRKIVRYGQYVVVNNIGTKLVFAADSFVIGIFLPISALAYYGIAGSLVDYLRSLINTMAGVLNPRSSAMEATEDRSRLAEMFLSASKGAMLLGLPVCIGFIVLGERFITLWMGPTYGPTSARVLAVLAFAQLVGAPHYVISAVLYGMGRHRIIAQCRILEGVANVVLSVILVQRHGIVGVAVGTLVPHAVVALGVLPTFMAGVLPFSRSGYYASVYGRPLAASLPFVVACYVLDRSVAPASLPAFFAAGALSMIVYALPCWFLALSTEERELLAERVRRLLPGRLL